MGVVRQEVPSEAWYCNKQLSILDSMDDYDSENDEPYAWVLPVLLLATIYRPQQLWIPSNRSYTGQEYIDDLLNCGSDIRICNQLRMQLETFNQLRNWLYNNSKLKDSRYISIEEKLLIFIYIAKSGSSNRAAQEQFNHGPETISKWEFIMLI